jgi:hypothetical protein
MGRMRVEKQDAAAANARVGVDVCLRSICSSIRTGNNNRRTREERINNEGEKIEQHVFE